MTTKAKPKSRRRRTPQPDPPKRATLSLVNGRTAWLCPDCNLAHEIDERICSCGYDCRDDLATIYAERGLGVPETPEAAAEKAAAAGDVDLPPGVVPLQQVPHKSVRPSPDNPRRTFDEQALATLADSIKQHGLLQPILCWRPRPDELEIIDGERRWRACRLAERAEVQVRILDVTEEEAIELRGVANLQREDLDPIEEAIWIQQLLDRCGFTQAALAKRLGWKTQAQVAERVALLKLPDDWQQRVISREIAPTHARFLMAWRDRPAVLDRAAELLAKVRGDAERVPTAAEFETIVQNAAREVSRTLRRDQWGDGGCLFKVTPERRAELDVQDVRLQWGDKTEPRAFNVKLWDRLQREAKKRKKAAEKAAEKKAAEADKSGEPDAHWWDVDRRLQRRLRDTIAERLTKRDRDLALRIVLLINDQAYGFDDWLDLGDASDGEVAAALLQADRKQLDRQWVDLARQTLRHDFPGIEIPVLLRIADHMGIDVLGEWTPEADDLRILRRPALLACSSRPAGDYDGESDDEVIEDLLANWQPGFVPRVYVERIEKWASE